MKLVDTNVLLYAVNPSAPHHDSARRWIEAELSTGSKVLFPWQVLTGFVRLTTGRALMPRPLSVEDAFEFVEEWIAVPGAVIPQTDSQHAARMKKLLAATGTGGNLVNDAHLAALAMQYGATVMSYDTDFDLFPDVDRESPPD